MDDSKGSGVFELETTDDGQFYQAVRHAIVSVPPFLFVDFISFSRDMKTFCSFHYILRFKCFASFI